MYKISKKKFDQAVSKLKEKRIIVIGDIILDEYLIGDVNRISPEAPVPVVWVKKENITLGGSGNVIKNLTRIGAISEVFARSGKDEKSKVLEELILRENPDKSDIHLLKSSRVPTTLKTRIIAGHQQICRVDREEIVEISEEEENEIFSDFEKAITLSDGVIISDYDKGYFSKSLIKRIIEVSVKNGKYISVDPQVRHFFLYNQVSILTPNHHEAGKALGRNILSDDEVESAGFELCDKLNAESMMITRGDRGMSIYIAKEKRHHHIPTVAKEVFDVTGAGDTVISVYTAFRVAGLTEIEAAIVSNSAAGVVVGKIGSATASADEISAALEQAKLFE